MSNPKVSIIVPVYNVEKYIHKCIDSILAQTYNDFECILIDDASPGNSGKICDEYEKKDARIKVIHKTINEGSSLARKTGFEHSRGYYIQFIDSDDWIEPDMLEKMVNKTISEDFDITLCGCYIDYENGKNIIVKQDFSKVNKIKFIKKILNISIKTYLVTKLFKRDIFQNIDFPIYSRSEDYAILLQYIYLANSIGFIDIPLYHYCFNPLSLSKDKTRKIKGQNEELNNWCFILNFLKLKFIDLNVFEPELSNRVNSLIYTKGSDKDLKIKLRKLYPKSGSFLHKTKYFLKLTIKRIIPYKTINFIKDLNFKNTLNKKVIA